jgi:hypothetical protein
MQVSGKSRATLAPAGGRPSRRRRAAARVRARGRRPAGPRRPLTRFLTSAESPYDGPLLNCVELMAGGKAARDRTEPEEPRAGRAGGRGRGAGRRPPPLIGAERKCPYKAWKRRIPAAADFLSPHGRRDPRPRSNPSTAHRPLCSYGKLRQ